MSALHETLSEYGLAEAHHYVLIPGLNQGWFDQVAVNRLRTQFQRLVRQATWRRFWGKLTGRRQRLRCLPALPVDNRRWSRSYRGIRLVPLAQICGSEGPCADVDADFRPLHSREEERWVRIALARERAELLPLVDLVQVGDSYFVRDGHHRVSVARSLGQRSIEAEVTEWQRW